MRIIPIQWQVPQGFKVAPKPTSRLQDSNTVGRYIYLNWKDYGWSLGKVKEMITAKNPQLFKKYNVRVVWAVEGKLNNKCNGPCKLSLDAYKSGIDAPLDSWVFLDLDQGSSYI